MLPLITVFTPTFNRAYCLPDVYNSLLKQTNKEFMWLIVDDGSTDNTKDLVSSWIIDNKISIEYHYQENAGKMAAHNLGAQICKTELFMCLDSDDSLVPKAIEEIYNCWNKYHSERKDLLGIIAPRQYVDHSGNITFIPQIPTGLTYTTGQNLYNNGFRGDTAMIFITEILRKYPFPIQEGEKFISEISAYDQMDEYYVMKTLNIPLMNCEYQDDGYSKNLLRINVQNPKGVIFVNQQRQTKINRFSPTLMREYIAYSLIARYSIYKIIKDSAYPFCCLLMLPVGLYDKNKIIKQVN